MEILTARIGVYYHFLLEGLLVGVFSDFNPYFEVICNNLFFSIKYNNHFNILHRKN